MTNIKPLQDDLGAYITSNVDNGLDLQPFLYQITEIDKSLKQITRSKEQDLKQHQARRSDTMTQSGVYLNNLGNFSSQQVVAQQQRPIGFSSLNELNSSLYNIGNENNINNNFSKRVEQRTFPMGSTVRNITSSQDPNRMQQWGTDGINNVNINNNNYNNNINNLSSLGNNSFDMMFNGGNNSNQNLTGGFTNGDRKDIWSF